MKNKFKLLSKYCKYLGLGHDDEGWIDICNKKSQIPYGHSWEKCNEKSCPFFKELNSSK